ncbi:MAG: carbamoyltransferase HypF, partial [Candidatus Hodarchaeota archaeon]
CSECGKEYSNPLDRRHHAQGMICANCGPKFTLYNKNNERIACKNPIKETASFIREGKVIAIKGIGGIHLACLASDNEIVQNFRKKRRKESRKPFAVMSESLNEVQKFAIIDEVARDLLLSWRRPIVLLPQREPFPLSKYIAPKLSNIGVFLPYMGMHYLLFSYLPNELALIMTSANTPNQPMLLDNNLAIAQLKDHVDFFLLHNRQIINRCDDSVVKLVNDQPIIIRRSRGYVPDPIKLAFKPKTQGISVGPELTATGTVVTAGRIIPTQHIGDVETLDNRNFLQSALRFMKYIFHVENIDWIAHDRHPDFISTHLAKKLAEEFEAQLIDIQHHHAHAASLIIDAGCQPDEEIICITADGFGFGTTDDPAWGGEILLASLEEYSRLGSLKPQPMPGGDRCAHYPGRMVASLLAPFVDEDQLIELLLRRCQKSFPYGKEEIKITLNQVKNPKIFTTSMGRVLDGISCLLGFTMKRSYEGEPAIVLEGQAKMSNKLPEFSLNQVNDQIPRLDTGELMIQILNALKTSSWNNATIAYGAQKALGKHYAKLAVEIAQNEGIKKIGFSGGVAYNDIITKAIAEVVSEEKKILLTHRIIPPGDAGISVGQAVIGSRLSDR